MPSNTAESSTAESSQVNSPSVSKQSPRLVITPKINSFKRPHTPNNESRSLDQPERRAFTPISRPQTPLYRTDLGSMSKLSDCIIPTVHISPTLQEITITFGSTYIQKPVIRNFKIENLKDSNYILEANLKHLKDTGFTIDFEGASLNSREFRLIRRADSPTSGSPKNCAIEIPQKSTVTVPINWVPPG
ncbi:hypothetical protein DSO57_1015602 [Entomophthora muscae]|uniref:Uncharacterized protein n=1 Tax=Entomophthora muscae TaxID=34485 RepID=A0ACC2SHZ0_9FUNG|nr:hypothetical protein DSO57_1015602 [Entomophthora muscae]